MKEGNINFIPEKPVKREQQAEKLTRFIDKTNTFDYFKSLTENETEKPSYEDFKNFLIRINGIARDIPIPERSFDGRGVGLSGKAGYAQVPKHEDKEELLKYAYDSLEKIEKEDLKYFVPGVINAIHLFKDGNGRTSRAVHQLLSDHNSKEDFQENLKISLGDDGRLDSVDVDPSEIYYEIEESVSAKNGWKQKGKDGLYFLGNVFRLAKNQFIDIPEEHPSFKYIKKFETMTGNRYEEKYAISALNKVLGGKIDSMLEEKAKIKGILSVSRLAEKVSEDEWNKIFEEYYKSIKEQVKSFINIFVNPNEHISEENSGRTLKDKFIRQIKSNSE